MDPRNKDDVIRINVGGKLYMTTFHLICRYRNSYLYKLIYEKLKERNDDNLQNQEIFIDRNGKRFEYILDFLRDGVLICENDINLLVKILIEAIYFKIVALIKILKKKIDLLYSKLDSSVNRKMLKSIFNVIEKKKQILSEAGETGEPIFDKSDTLANRISECEKLKFRKLKKKKKRHIYALRGANEKEEDSLKEENDVVGEYENDGDSEVKNEEVNVSHYAKGLQDEEKEADTKKYIEIEKDIYKRKNDKTSITDAKNYISSRDCSTDSGSSIQSKTRENSIQLINEKIDFISECGSDSMSCNVGQWGKESSVSPVINIHKDSCNRELSTSAIVNDTVAHNTTNEHVIADSSKHYKSSCNGYNAVSNNYCSNVSNHDNVAMKTKPLFLSPNRTYFPNSGVKSVSFSQMNHTLFFSKDEGELQSEDYGSKEYGPRVAPVGAHLVFPFRRNNNGSINHADGTNPPKNIIIYDDVNDIEETTPPPPPVVSNINLGEQIFSTTVDF